MAPKNKQKKKALNHELSVEEMTRMGMSADDIARIMVERSKSSEEKKVELEKEAALRRELEQRHRLVKEISKKCDEVTAEEQNDRVSLLNEEDKTWVPFLESLTKEKIPLLRLYNEQEELKRVHLAKKKREEELKTLYAEIEKMTPEERAAIAAAAEEEENQKTLACLQVREAKLRKEERRAARRAARRARNREEDEFESFSDDASADLASSEDYRD